MVLPAVSTVSCGSVSVVEQVAGAFPAPVPMAPIATREIVPCGDRRVVMVEKSISICNSELDAGSVRDRFLIRPKSNEWFSSANWSVLTIDAGTVLRISGADCFLLQADPSTNCLDVESGQTLLTDLHQRSKD